MPDAASAPAAAQSQQEQTPDPFAGFITESYRQGEREEPQQPTPAPAPAPSPQQDEQQTPAEREQAETPQQEEGEQQVAEDGEQGGRKKGTLQERINELTRQRHDERRRAEAAEDRMRRLEEELEALRTGGTPPQQARTQPPVGHQQPQQPAQQGQEQQGDDPAPDPEQFDYGELDPRFIAATAAHAARQAYREQREAEQREAEQRAQMEQGKSRMTAFVERAQKGAATKYPDFAERVFGDSDKYPVSEELGALILESPVGDEIAYHLATHHEEARAIYALSPLDQARSFGRLEARFSAGGSAAPAKPAEEAPVTPRTPPPVLPARGANGRFQTTAATDDFAAFEASVKSQNAG